MLRTEGPVQRDVDHIRTDGTAESHREIALDELRHREHGGAYPPHGIRRRADEEPSRESDAARRDGQYGLDSYRVDGKAHRQESIEPAVPHVRPREHLRDHERHEKADEDRLMDEL